MLHLCVTQYPLNVGSKTPENHTSVSPTAVSKGRQFEVLNLTRIVFMRLPVS